MNIQAFTLGPFATNCYLVWADGDESAFLIDCAGEAERILDQARDVGVEIKTIVNTHGHADHMEDLAALKRDTSALVAIHALDAPMLSDAMLSGAAIFGYPQPHLTADILLSEGESVTLPGSDLALTVLHTPGHTPGSICLLGEGVLFTGDCLFAGGIGRVDLPGGDEHAMMHSLARLSRLDPELVVYPGHGLATSIGRELATNPWLTGL